jgi:hypothetical protein
VDPAPPPRHRRRPWSGWWVVAAVVVLTAVQAGGALVRQRHLPLSGDAALLYRPAALDLLHHLRFSVQDQAPYLPTIAKMPGYPAFVAVVYAVSGERPGAVVVAQFALVAVTALLVGALARRRFDAAVGACTAVLVALYPPLPAFAEHHLSEVLTCCLVAALLLAVERLERRVTDPAAALWRPAAAVGSLLGALVLVRQSLALLAVAVVAALWWTGRGAAFPVPNRRRAGAVVVVAAVAASVAGPWMVRNVVVSGRFVPFGASSGFSRYVSAGQYRGDYANALRPSDVADYVAEIDRRLAVIDARLGPPVGSSAGMAEGIGGGPARELALDDALTAEADRQLAALTWTEVVAAVPARVASLWAPLPSAGEARARWAALAGLVAAGVVLARRRGGSHWTLWILAAYLTVLHLRFHVETRYSLPARPVLLVYAAVALVTGWRAAWGRFGPAARSCAGERLRV